MNRAIFSFTLLVLFFVSLPFYPASASKGGLAVREDLGAMEKPSKEPNQNEPFFSSHVIIEGLCRDVDVPVADSKKIRWLYRLDKEKAKVTEVGKLYYNDLGQEAVCFDDLAVVPFVVKNVRGEMVSISGWIDSGDEYNLPHADIIIVDSIRLMGDFSE